MRSFKKVLGVLSSMLITLATVTMPQAALAAGAYVRDCQHVLSDQLARFTAQVGLALGANTITNLIPTLYEALDVVSREMVGFIPAVSRDSNMERAAKNQTINVFIAPPITGADITPGVTAPNDGDAVIGNTTMTITKSRYWPVRWNGEEQKAVSGSGQGANVIRDQFAQAFRAAVNEIELDLAALHIFGSRAFGAAGTVPFATVNVLDDTAQTLKILDDNGAPTTDRRLVLGSAAMANIRGKQSQLFKVNEAGTEDLLRRGFIGELEGYMVGKSGQIATNAFTAGTSNGAYTTTAAGFAVGTTSIPLITGAGTILAGDAITFAGDTNIYMVQTGIAAPGTIVIAEPGLRVAMSAATKAVTTIASCPRSLAFSRSAIALGTRAPALPDGGDMASDRTMVTDPVSGISFEVSLYRQYRQIKYEIAVAWGVKAVAPRHIAVLLGG